MVIYLDLDEDLLFPDSDGQPMSDNTEQYEWIVKIKENLENLNYVKRNNEQIEKNSVQID